MDDFGCFDRIVRFDRFDCFYCRVDFGVEGLDRFNGFGEGNSDSSSSCDGAASCFGVGGFGDRPCWRL